MMTQDDKKGRRLEGRHGPSPQNGSTGPVSPRRVIPAAPQLLVAFAVYIRGRAVIIDCHPAPSLEIHCIHRRGVRRN